MENKLWSAADLAKHANVSTAYLRRQLIDGKIKGVKIANNWLIEDIEVQRWLASRRPRKKKN